MPNTLRDSSKGRQTVLANFRLHKDEYQALKRQAEQCRISFSELLRRIALAAIPKPIDPELLALLTPNEKEKKESVEGLESVAPPNRRANGKATARCWHGLPLHQCYTCNNI
jgi:hypothetical protein